MHRLGNLRDNLCEELEKVAKKSELTPNDLELVDKLAHSIKNIDKILYNKEASHEQMYSGEYNRRSYARRGRDGDGDGRYSERSYDSYDIGRNSNRMYSREHSNRMSERLRSMMSETSNSQERDALMKCIEEMERN